MCHHLGCLLLRWQVGYGRVVGRRTLSRSFIGSLYLLHRQLLLLATWFHVFVDQLATVLFVPESHRPCFICQSVEKLCDCLFISHGFLGELSLGDQELKLLFLLPGDVEKFAAPRPHWVLLLADLAHDLMFGIDGVTTSWVLEETRTLLLTLASVSILIETLCLLLHRGLAGTNQASFLLLRGAASACLPCHTVPFGKFIS